MLVVTTNDIAGHNVARYLGVVRGITVRSRSIFGNIGAMIQALFGGNTGLRATGHASALPPLHCWPRSCI